MIAKKHIIFKAAVLIAAFSFQKFVLASESLVASEVQKKVTALLLLKQRDQAFDIIDKAIDKSAKDIESVKQLKKIKYITATTFMSQEAQDSFELAASYFIQNPKSSKKNYLKCLSLEPDNAQCLWLEISYTRFYGDYDKAMPYINKFTNQFQNIPEMKLLVESLQKNGSLFLSAKYDTTKIDPKNDYYLLPLILEFDRSIKAKNYSQAKWALSELLLRAPDYPDIMMMQNQLEYYSEGKEKTLKQTEIAKIYKMKCMALPQDIYRKYYYDIDLCRRGLE